MNLRDFLVRFMRNNVPDGRPLYAYKCRNQDYDAITMAVREMLTAAVRGNPHLFFSSLFCFYAAETWRRKHTGGPWKWETVFAEICNFVPAHANIAKWVKEGIGYWRRAILKSRTGTNEYLVTIACEGGLPLLLLQRENACLNRYFKNLLKSYHHERQSPFCDAVEIASRLSSCLPSSLRHDIVFNLGGNLVKKIVELQEEVPEAVEPIQALDMKNKNWRDLLPLPLEDRTVELLLNNLVKEAQTLAITERQRVRWRRRLSWIGGETVTIEQLLEVPAALTGATLQEWCNCSELPARMQLLSQSAKGTDRVALITLLRGDGEGAIYRCEVLRRGRVRMVGQLALNPIQLLISYGNAEAVVPVHGGSEWGPLPWAFAERTGQWELIGEGSVRCKDDTVRVLFPMGGRIVSDGGSAAMKAEVKDLQRELWEVTGTVLWEHVQMGSCRIRCANLDAADVSYMVGGRTLAGTADRSPPYLGVPSLQSIHNLGGVRNVDDAISEWRPDKPGENVWYTDHYRCAGSVWLRWANTEGEQLLCRKIRVVPSAALIEMAVVGVGQKPGRIRLKGFTGAAVSVGEVSGCEVTRNPEEDRIEIDCFGDAGLPLTQFPVHIFWSDGRNLEMRLPFPREGGAFVYADETLSQGARVPVAKLAAIQAVVQTTSIARKFRLKVKIKADNNLFRNLSIRNTVSVDDNHRGSFQLHRLQKRIESILALTGELDSIAVLEIIDQGNRCLAYLEAGQFDMVWETDWDQRRLWLSDVYTERLESGWQDRLRVRMVPLWNPTAEPLFLDNGKTDTEWVIPEDIPAGPWWVLGEDGDWARFRPQLWVIHGESESTDSPLKRAILNSDRKTRDDLLRRWVEQISETPDHPDWSLFYSYLDLVRPYPACALDLFRHFVKSSEAMVTALLQSTDDNFDAVWSLSYQLPFSWYLVPVGAWLSAAKRYFVMLRVALAEIGSADQILWDNFQVFRDRVTVRRPFFRQMCDWLCPVIFPERTLESSELDLAQRCPGIIYRFIQEEEQKLQGRHGADERYPDGPETMRWTEKAGYPERYNYINLSHDYRPVRCAPFVAAYISLNGESYKETLLFELKRLRDFDRDWFRTVYAFALCLGLSRIPVICSGGTP